MGSRGKRVIMVLAVLLAVHSLQKRGQSGLAAAPEGSTSATASLSSPAAAVTSPTRGTLVEGLGIYPYLCFLPTDYGKQPERWPLIMFLHGACRDENLEKLKNFGPIKFGREHDDFPFLVVAPASSRGWSPRLLSVFLDKIEAHYSVDRDRVYLTGYSLGGHATWQMACSYPDRFAALAPVAGGGDPRVARARLRHVAVWVFHGAKDTVVPVEYGQTMIRAMTRAGGEVKSTVYADRGHDTWDVPYENPELYTWFLKHRRPGSEAGKVPSSPPRAAR